MKQNIPAYANLMPEEEQLLGQIREKMKGVEKLDPDGEFYKNLCSFLDKVSDQILTILMEGEIKFVSSLARNRLNRRKKV